MIMFRDRAPPPLLANRSPRASPGRAPCHLFTSVNTSLIGTPIPRPWRALAGPETRAARYPLPTDPPSPPPRRHKPGPTGVFFAIAPWRRTPARPSDARSERYDAYATTYDVTRDAY